MRAQIAGGSSAAFLRGLVTISSPTILEPQQADFDRQVAMLPEAPGIYCLFVDGGSPHLAWSANMPRRLKRLLLGSHRQHADASTALRQRVSRVECWTTGSKLESSLVMYQIARKLFPTNYLERLRLRMPWFIVITSLDNFGRLGVVNRSRRDGELMFGPFASRDTAEFYEQAVLSLFPIRRCTEKLMPSPSHPGCIYGEIRQCLRPCQSAVSGAEYETEVKHMTQFLHSNGTAAIATLSQARKVASEQMDFEDAAALHKRIEQLKNAVGVRDRSVAEVQSFNGIALTRGGQPGWVSLWPMQSGYWQQPILLNAFGDAKSLDSELRSRLAEVLSAPTLEGNQVEQLAIFSRWYRSSWRDGSWLEFRTAAEVNYRKVLRAIAKLAGETPASPPPELVV